MTIFNLAAALDVTAASYATAPGGSVYLEVTGAGLSSSPTTSHTDYVSPGSYSAPSGVA